MSTRLRFNTAQQVFDAFPKVTAEIDLRPTEEPPLDFARKLLARAHRFDAIVFTACLLPRREGVWWGCQCVRALRGNQADDALLAAEAWVREPEEAQRRAALEIAASGDTRVATTWLALAAGHSGGSVAAEGSAPGARFARRHGDQRESRRHPGHRAAPHDGGAGLDQGLHGRRLALRGRGRRQSQSPEAGGGEVRRRLIPGRKSVAA